MATGAQQGVVAFVALGVLIATFLLFGVLRGTIAQTELTKPTFVRAGDQTSAPKPPDDRQVTILTLVIRSAQDGKVDGVQLERGRIIQSYAPNVLGLAGPWTVELIGEKENVR